LASQGSPKALHLVLVGTSLLRNTVGLLERCAAGDTRSCAALRLDMLKAQDALRLLYESDRGGCRQPPPGSAEDRRCGRLFREDPLVRGALEGFLEAAPYAASAELNAMQGALEGGCECVGGVSLLYSDTEVGEAAALALKGYLSRVCGVRVDAVRIPYLGVRFAAGLEKLKEAILQAARRYGGPVALNLTGGFKPEGAAAAVIGYAAPNIYLAYYRHEAFRETVVIPLTPASVAASILGCLRGGRLSCSSEECVGFAAALCSVDPRRHGCSCEGDCPGALVGEDLVAALKMLL